MSITVTSDGLVEVVDLSPGPVDFVELQQGPPGPAGLPGPGVAIEFPFSWGDAFPSTIDNTLIGETIFKVEVIVKTPFDTSSSLSLGDTLDNESVVPAEAIDLSTVGTYQYTPGLYFPVGKQINVYLTLGVGNSTGDGLILFYK